MRDYRVGLVTALLALASAYVALLAAPLSAQTVGSGPCSGAGGPCPPELAVQVARGADVFAQTCVACHGERGQGTDDGPELVAPGALLSFRNAERLFDFVSAFMPDDDPGSLSSEDAYAVIAFLLDRNNLNQTGAVLGPEVAASIGF